jgi:hypothetical protein
MIFAPSAYRLIQQVSQGELGLKCDADPQNTWMQLCWFEECWSIRNEELWIGWHRCEGSGLEVWLKAHQGYMRARLCRMAGDFAFVDHYGADRKTEFFHRDVLQGWLQRVISELLLLLRKQQRANPPGQDEITLFVVPKGRKKIHGRTTQMLVDLGNLRPIGEKIWRQTIAATPEKDWKSLPREDVEKEIIKRAKAEGIALHLDVPARYERAAKETDPRLWENGAFQGLKPGYNAQEGGV